LAPVPGDLASLSRQARDVEELSTEQADVVARITTCEGRAWVADERLKALTQENMALWTVCCEAVADFPHNPLFQGVAATLAVSREGAAGTDEAAAAATGGTLGGADNAAAQASTVNAQQQHYEHAPFPLEMHQPFQAGPFQAESTPNQYGSSHGAAVTSGDRLEAAAGILMAVGRRGPSSPLSRISEF
jgi:hypothetical protein